MRIFIEIREICGIKKCYLFAHGTNKKLVIPKKCGVKNLNKNSLKDSTMAININTFFAQQSVATMISTREKTKKTIYVFIVRLQSNLNKGFVQCEFKAVFSTRCLSGSF